MIDRGRLTFVPDYAPNPWLACAVILVDDHEIVAVVYYDPAPVPGFFMGPDGVVSDDPADADLPTGWCVQVLADTGPAADDPRTAAPIVHVIGGADLSLEDAIRRGLDMASEAGDVANCNDFVWRGVPIGTP